MPPSDPALGCWHLLCEAYLKCSHSSDAWFTYPTAFKRARRSDQDAVAWAGRASHTAALPCARAQAALTPRNAVPSPGGWGELESSSEEVREALLSRITRDRTLLLLILQGITHPSF